MKGKLERNKGDSSGKNNSNSNSSDTKYADIDSSLAKLQRKLTEGSAMETGERGANKVYRVNQNLCEKSYFYTLLICGYKQLTRYRVNKNYSEKSFINILIS